MATEPSLRDISTFVAIVDCDGAARAAAALGYTQPAVTLQLQRLEKALGFLLFDRRGRQLVLTQRGRRALESARRLLAETKHLKTIALDDAENEHATLTIAVLEPTASLRIVPVLEKIRQKLPRANLKLIGLGAANIAKAAEAGVISAALTSSAQVPGWSYEPLFEERLSALVPDSHPLASQSTVSLSRLASETLVLTDESCVYRKAVERAFARSNAVAKVAVETGSVAWLPSAVASGFGVSIVPKNIAIPPRLRLLPIRERITFSIGLLRPSIIPVDSALSLFVEEAMELRY